MKICESLMKHQGILTEARQVEGGRKTEIKDIKAITLQLFKRFASLFGIRKF